MDERKSIPCIKCGREIGADGVFCEECLTEMARHPVKPGTPVVLHQKPTDSIRRAPTRKVRKPEEHVRSLKRAIVWLWILIFLLFGALGTVTALWLTKTDAQQLLHVNAAVTNHTIVSRETWCY